METAKKRMFNTFSIVNFRKLKLLLLFTNNKKNLFCDTYRKTLEIFETSEKVDNVFCPCTL